MGSPALLIQTTPLLLVLAKHPTQPPHLLVNGKKLRTWMVIGRWRDSVWRMHGMVCLFLVIPFLILRFLSSLALSSFYSDCFYNKTPKPPPPLIARACSVSS